MSDAYKTSRTPSPEKRFGVNVTEQDFERLKVALDKVRAAERAVDRDRVIG